MEIFRIITWTKVFIIVQCYQLNSKVMICNLPCFGFYVLYSLYIQITGTTQLIYKLLLIWDEIKYINVLFRIALSYW